MRLVLLVLGTLALCPLRSLAQSSPDTTTVSPIGREVRFQLIGLERPRQVQGVYLGTRGDSLLLLDPSTGRDAAFDLAAVRELERQIKSGSGSAGVLIGALLGTAGTQLAICAATRPCIGPGSIPFSILVGGVLGGVIGWRLAPGSRWESWQVPGGP